MGIAEFFKILSLLFELESLNSEPEHRAYPGTEPTHSRDIGPPPSPMQEKVL